MKKNDRVRILKDSYGYKKGDIGVVVDTYNDTHAHVFVEGRKSLSVHAPNVVYPIEDLELIPTSITEEIQQLEKRLVELKAMQDNKRFVPKEGEKYYYLTDTLAVDDNYCMGHDYIDSTHIHTHNCFRTEEEAEQRAKTISKKYDIINRIEQLNEGWKPDWEDGDQLKESIVEIDGEFKVRAGSVEKLHSDALYFKSASIGFQLIKEFGDDLGCLFEL